MDKQFVTTVLLNSPKKAKITNKNFEDGMYIYSDEDPYNNCIRIYDKNGELYNIGECEYENGWNFYYDNSIN